MVKVHRTPTTAPFLCHPVAVRNGVDTRSAPARRSLLLAIDGGNAQEESQMTGKKAVGLAMLALVLFWVIVYPTEAANGIQTVLGILRDAAEAVITFVRNLTD
jgi:hypothetical protein